jgi:hypothetical protein
MKPGKRSALTRLNDLQQQTALLANLRPAGGIVISCYLDLAEERSRLENFVRNRLGALLVRVPDGQRGALQSCIDVIHTQLESDLPMRTRGLAVFAAADGKAPLLSAMPFAVPFRNSLSVSRSPDLLPLLKLKELYGRFMIVMARPEGLQLAEVNLGDVSVKVWATNPHAGASHAGGQNRIQTAGTASLLGQVELIEQRLGKGGSCPLFLAGDIDVMQSIRELLGASSIARLMGALPMPGDHTLESTAAVCLRALMDFETSQARDTAARILRGVRQHGQAVAGVEASLDAMRSGMVDRLVIASDFRPEDGWAGDPGIQVGTFLSPPEWYPEASAHDTNPPNLRAELIRLAAQQRFPLEFADSEALNYLGGVGCLLRDHPQAWAQPSPSRYGNLDLVA